MSGYLTADGADYFLNLFRNGEPPIPMYYLALVVGSQPGVTATGIELEEPVIEEYARAEVPNESGNWDMAQQSLTNLNEIAFPVPSEDWGNCRYWALCDAAESGRVLVAGELEAFEITSGNQVFFNPGTLEIALELDSWAATL